MSDILLGVNIDHVATLRQARYRDTEGVPLDAIEPDPVAAALQAELAGADGITLHLREDKRHIQPDDVIRMRAKVSTRINLEMACTDAMLAFALDVKPDTVCLVPESREEVTTEGGLDVIENTDRVASVVEGLHAEGIAVSLFIDPDEKQVRQSAELKADFIELHTGCYANAFYGSRKGDELKRVSESLKLGKSLGLTVNAGHGINYDNVKELAVLEGFHEFNIGHSILSRAMLSGIGEAVALMKQLMNER